VESGHSHFSPPIDTGENVIKTQTVAFNENRFPPAEGISRAIHAKTPFLVTTKEGLGSFSSSMSVANKQELPALFIHRIFYRTVTPVSQNVQQTK
jgi:hypothetical protein